jgi:APA family basic amino acid/polyamine antiporter
LRGASRISAVLLAILWAYNAWHGVTPLAEEIRQPQRNLPLALVLGIGLLIGLYVSANVAYHGVLSMEQMKTAGDHAAEVMLTKLLGPLGGAAMSAVIMCSAFGTINSNLLQAPRVGLAMGRDRVFFHPLGQVHPRYRTPASAIGVLAGMASFLVILAAAGKSAVLDMTVDPTRWPLMARIVTSLQQDSIFTLLTNFVIFSASIFYALTVLALLVLRYRRPEANRPYRTWGYPLTPLIFLCAYTWFLWQVYLHQPLESRIGLMLIAACIPCYWL